MIRYQFMGRVPNEEVIDFYCKQCVDCFVMTSEKEGLPVAIMEAESAGIPVVSTNVGGIKEAIRENGVLLDKKTTPKMVADAILSVLNASYKKKQMMRDTSRIIWEEKFDAEKNAKNFVKKIKTRSGKRPDYVYLVTEGYPYDSFEKSFLEIELREMLRHFRVTLIACVNRPVTQFMKKEAQNNIKDLIDRDIDRSKLCVLMYQNKILIQLIPFLMKYVFDKRVKQEKNEIWTTKRKRRIRLWESMKYYARSEAFYLWFKKRCKQKNGYGQAVIYTYWNLHATLGLCLNRENLYESTIISRAHGYDYQHEQWDRSLRKPFLKTVDGLIDGLIFVCQTGMEDYFRDNGIVPDPDKYSFSYLGCKDAKKEYHKREIKSYSQEDRRLIVSCASLIPLKRIFLVIDALSIVGESSLVDIQWVHFGDGPLENEIMNYAKEKLIYELQG